MARTLVNLPDGRKEYIDHPEGASEADILGFAKQQYEAGAFGEAPKDYSGMSTGEKVMEGLSNVPESGAKLAGALYEAVTNPIDTATAIYQVGKGAIQLAMPEIGVNIDGDPEAQQMAKNVGQFYVDRYGTPEAAQRAMIEDPVGVLADISLAFTGAGAGLRAGAAATKAATGAKAGTIAGETLSGIGGAGQKLMGAGSAIEPLTATTKGALALGRGATNLAGATAGRLAGQYSGTGYAPIQAAYQAGREGGEVGESFRAAMRGDDDMSAVVASAEDAVKAMKDRAFAAYRTNKQALAKDKNILSFNDTLSAIQRGKQMAMSGKIVKRPSVLKYVDEAEKAVKEWIAGDPRVNHTAAGFDDLKQRLDDIYESIPINERTAQSAVLQIKKSVQNSISKQAPAYAKYMKDYSNAMETIKEIQKSLSMGKNASAETKLRKLQSVMRDNVNTGYGSRAEKVKMLDEEGANIMPRVAGQSMQSWMPRGIQGATTPLAAGGLALYGANWPAGLAAMAAGSPRVVGEVSHALGRAGQVVDPVAATLRKFDQPTIMNALYQMQRAEEEKR